MRQSHPLSWQRGRAPTGNHDCHVGKVIFNSFKMRVSAAYFKWFHTVLFHIRYRRYLPYWVFGTLLCAEFFQLSAGLQNALSAW